MLTLFGFQRPRLRFFKLTANGKSIGEVRAFEELKAQGRLSVANAFSDCLNYEKKQYEKQRRINFSNLSIIYLTPHFANTMLSAGIILVNFERQMIVFCFVCIYYIFWW